MAYVLGEQYKQRVDRALSVVEGMPSQGGVFKIPTRFETLPQPAGEKAFRICTFTGSWAINASKTVTFNGVTSTPNTVAAVNVFTSLPDRGTQHCGIAKDGTAWHLVAWPPVTATATVVTNVSLGTAGLRFETMQVRITETVSSSVITIGTTSC